MTPIQANIIGPPRLGHQHSPRALSRRAEHEPQIRVAHQDDARQPELELRPLPVVRMPETVEELLGGEGYRAAPDGGKPEHTGGLFVERHAPCELFLERAEQAVEQVLLAREVAVHERPRAPGDPFTLGFVGRLKDNKGLDLLVAALPELPHYCRLVFIGNGPMKEHLAQQAQRLGVVQRVIFKGGLPTYEIPREMQQLDALVLPSVTRPNWIEQFGRVLPEAMACETPVIGSSSGEIPHVIGDAGLVFEEGNVQELVACIRQLLDDPELYAQLAAKGRQRVLENYTQEQIARQTYKVYQQMLA